MNKMKMRTKILIGCGVLLLAILTLLVVWWVQSRTGSEMKDDVAFQLCEVDALMSQPHKEMVALLSAKYAIDELQLEQILAEYDAKHDVALKLRKGIAGEATAEQGKGTEPKVNLNFAETLNTLSGKYLLPKDKLAAILIDYRVLSGVEKGSLVDKLLSENMKNSVMKLSIKGLLGGVRSLR